MSFEIGIIKGENWPKADTIGWCDPFLIIEYTDGGYEKSYKTNYVTNTSNPFWNEIILVGDIERDFVIKCFDKDTFSKDDYLGKIRILLPKIEHKQVLIFNVDLEEKYKHKRKDNTKETTVILTFRPI